METTERSIQKVISKKALKMGSSFPCQLCVVGFFFGICLTYFFMASLTSFGGLELSTLGLSIPMARNSSYSSTSDTIYMDARGNRSFTPFQLESRRASQDKEEWQRVRVTVLDSVWGALLNESADEVDQLLSRLGMTRSSVPRAPHSENCEKIMEVNKQLDTWGENGTFPPWTSWKGLLKQHKHIVHHDEPEAYQPPWIVGSDGDNFPLTRRVQKDIWIHQHPSNCSDPHVRFLIADWETLPGFGIGAQVAGMCGLLAIAMNEHRILVTKYYNRADHAGCRGEFRSHWSCYFFLETSRECQHRAFDHMKRKEAWENGIVTGKDNYTSKEIWAGRIPRIWGNPWDYLQPTTEINGTLITHHRKMERRWWRAQAVRYLMRFQSRYTCHLMNIARHKAFGLQAAAMVLENLKGEWPKGPGEESESDIEEIVWSKHKPWNPRPLISMHVRMGDKACEMKVVEFKTYMHLADRIRKRFPNIHSIWLSTEMQEVIDELKSYPNWNFYYTNISRQLGNTSMAAYEARLGREISTNYPLVNFLMATEADFFIGALGSTWCFLIDGMRNTGGKVMAGYLSVNKDRFW